MTFSAGMSIKEFLMDFQQVQMKGLKSFKILKKQLDQQGNVLDWKVNIR